MSRRPPPRRPGVPPGAVVKLTQAEAAVVARAARGLSNREIATALRKSPATVKGQVGGPGYDAHHVGQGFAEGGRVSVQAQEIVRHLLDQCKPAQVHLIPGDWCLKNPISENTPIVSTSTLASVSHA